MSSILCRILSVEWLITDELKREGYDVVNVNVNTAIRSIRLDENADEQTEAIVPEPSLAEPIVGRVVHNPYI